MLTEAEIKDRVEKITGLEKDKFSVVFLRDSKKVVLLSGEYVDLTVDMVEDIGDISYDLLDDGWNMGETVFGVKEVRHELL